MRKIKFSKKVNVEDAMPIPIPLGLPIQLEHLKGLVQRTIPPIPIPILV